MFGYVLDLGKIPRAGFRKWASAPVGSRGWGPLRSNGGAPAHQVDWNEQGDSRFATRREALRLLARSTSESDIGTNCSSRGGLCMLCMLQAQSHCRTHISRCQRCAKGWRPYTAPGLDVSPCGMDSAILNSENTYVSAVAIDGCAGAYIRRYCSTSVTTAVPFVPGCLPPGRRPPVDTRPDDVDRSHIYRFGRRRKTRKEEEEEKKQAL